ncbi:MAG: GNAT family N-acetyltransferase [Candidatus Aenigmarchaeota archaeon]|nr:GNAT family N-acetyltransferase [Candidatus Aenigmarchaeota archaeon]
MAKIIEYNDLYKAQTKKFILRILIEEFGLDTFERPDLDAIRSVYQEGGSNFWIAVENNKVIGSVAIINYGNKRGYLKRMYVDKEYRGSGLAKRLLGTAVKYARASGIKVIFLGTIEGMGAANKFYKKNGFERIEKLPDDLPGFGDTIFYKLTL